MGSNVDLVHGRHASVVQRAPSGLPDPGNVKTGGRFSWLLRERSALFAGLAFGDYANISRAARPKQFARGETLYLEGDSIRRVLLVTGGCVKITQVSAGGSKVILRLGIPGDVLGAVDLFCTGTHFTTAQAFRSCNALVWDSAMFKSLVERLPAVHHNLIRIIGADLQELENRFREVATEKVAPRVARQLVRLVESIGRETAGVVEVELSRQDLAQMTGTTLFTVSRLLSGWEARGLLRLRREAVAVCDLESIRVMAHGD